MTPQSGQQRFANRRFANRQSAGWVIRSGLAHGLLLWADWLEELSVRVRQRAARLEQRALEQWDEGHDQDGGEPGEQAADARPGPPPEWVARTASGGPPAHWVAHIRRKAPRLLANWQPGSPFPGLESRVAGSGSPLARQVGDVGVSGAHAQAEDALSESAPTPGSSSEQADPETGQPTQAGKTGWNPFPLLGRRARACASGRGNPAGERAGMPADAVGQPGNRVPTQPVETAPGELGQPGDVAGAVTPPPHYPGGVTPVVLAARQRALLQRARFRLQPSSSGATGGCSGAGKTEGSWPSDAKLTAADRATGIQGIAPSGERILRPLSPLGEKQPVQAAGEQPQPLRWPGQRRAVPEPVHRRADRPAPTDGERLRAESERPPTRAEMPAEYWPPLPEESPPSASPENATDSGGLAWAGEQPASQGGGLPQGADWRQNPVDLARQARARQHEADGLEERDYWPALPDYDEVHEEGAAAVDWERMSRARERLERLEREQRGQLWNG